MNGLKSIVCAKNHCYDLSKKGYVNLLPNSVKTEYGKDMLQSRNVIIKSGLFEPMIQRLGGLILEKAYWSSGDAVRILDAGCGEGSHLVRVIDNIKSSLNKEITGVGIDISKEGIQIASRDYPGITWCVADLTNIPFTDNGFNIVLNILSPSNYVEFGRVLRNDGILIKVVPGSGYLKELRGLFYDNTDKQEYSNEKVIAHFRNCFDITGTQRILYSTHINPNNLEHLIRMTPLSWRADNERIRNALGVGIDSITVDLTVLLGRNE
jgi:23S rRNA (guanine745-N1)-methyltransferase